MSQLRIHILGASGSGTSTLGRALANKLSIQFFDADDYFWKKTDVPYSQKNRPEKRVQMILAEMNQTEGWVLSGSIVNWGDVFIRLFTQIVFITLPSDIRLQRLRKREQQRYGQRLDVGGDMHQIHKEFMAWAALYDTADESVRSLVRHEKWMEQLECPVIRIESLKPVDELVDDVIRQMIN